MLVVRWSRSSFTDRLILNNNNNNNNVFIYRTIKFTILYALQIAIMLKVKTYNKGAIKNIRKRK